jgi:hypothetical protein
MASRKEQKEALRRERLEREQKAAQAAARKRMIGIVVAAVLVLGIAGALAAVVLSGGDDGGGGSGGDVDAAQVSFPSGAELPEQEQAALTKALPGSGCKTEQVEAEGAGQHVEEPVAYESEPPAVGPHSPSVVEDALYEEAPRTEEIVHALEHGRVIIWVRPDAPEELLSEVKALYDEDPYHVIVTPRQELEEPLAASAWQKPDIGHILRCARPGEATWDAIRAFKAKYRDKSPEFVP